MLRLVALLTGFLASGAHAQSAGPMTNADCLQSYAAFVALAQTNRAAVSRSGATRVTADGWCSSRDLRIDGDAAADLLIGQFDWRIDEFERMDDGLPPTALSLRARGLAYVPRVDDPLLNYLFDLQYGSSQIAADLHVSWDAATQTLTLSEAEMRVSEGNRVRLLATVAGIDLADHAVMGQSVLQAALTRLTLEVESNGLFEQYVAFPLGTILLDGTITPEMDVADHRQRARNAVARLPMSVFDAASLDALDRLLLDMPRPAGLLRVDASSDDGVRILQLAPLLRGLAGDSLQRLITTLPGLDIDVTYQETAP